MFDSIQKNTNSFLDKNVGSVYPSYLTANKTPPAQVPTQTASPILGPAKPILSATPQGPTKPVSVAGTGQGYWSDTGWVSGPTPQAYTDTVNSQIGVLNSAGIVPPTKIDNVNFSIPKTDTFNSTNLTGANVVDANSAYNNAYNNFISGKSNATPTDKYMNQLYNQSLYTPQEQDALKQYATATQGINEEQLAQRRQIDKLLSDGAITKVQARDFVAETKRRSDVQLADLATQQSAASLSLGVLGQIRGNNVAALNSLSPYYKPEQIAPGSTLANAQGQNFFQGAGASPSTILQTAQQLADRAMQSGTMQYNSDGSPNLDQYIKQAQDYYNTHQTIGGGQTNAGGGQMTGANSNQPTLQSGGVFTPQSDGTYLSPRGFSINSNEVQKVSKIPSQFQNYVDGGPLGTAYINADRVPRDVQAAMMRYASQVGIPYLTASEATGVQSVDSILQNLNLMQKYANTALSSGFAGRIAGLTTNELLKYTQSGKLVADPVSGEMVPLGVVLQNFNQFKDAAGKAVTALAGGQGSGFRMNIPVIENAVSNLATSKDSLESAMSKIKDFAGIVMNQYSTVFPSVKGINPLTGINSGGVINNSSTTGNSMIDTKVGKIDNNWFN